MFKKILAIMAMLYAAASFAAVDVNKATATGVVLMLVTGLIILAGRAAVITAFTIDESF